MLYFSSQKNYLTMSAIIIIFMSNLISITSSGDTDTVESECFEVDWKVAYKPPLIFGGDVILNCKTTVDIDLCTQCRKVWFGGPERNLLSLDGFPTKKSSKYLPTIRKDGSFEIIITNFNRKDLNQYYTCSIGKNSCDRNLTIDMFDILDDDVSGGDSNSSSNKTNLTITMGVSGTLLVIVIVCFIYIQRNIIIYKLRRQKENMSTTEDYTEESTADYPVFKRSVSKKSRFNQNIQTPCAENEKPFIQPTILIKVEKLGETKDEFEKNILADLV